MTFLFSLLLFFSTACFAQLESASPAMTPAAQENKNALETLTPSEREEFLAAHQKALMDPAVQSTREISRMALHKAMLHVDPSVETIFANIDAHGPQNGIAISHHQKSLGGNFQQWLANFPPSALAALTAEEKEKLQNAHSKALLEPSVQQARKDAHLVFYNAMMNADPLIAPLLKKVGIATPASVRPLSSKNNNLGSEEQILGGNFQAWGEEVLAPAIKAEASPASSAQ